MAVGFVASATSGSQASVASFSIGTLGTGARAGIVFVATHGTGDLITGVTWNGVAMSRLFQAVDTDTEPGSVVAYFLDNVTNGTITVSRTNNAVVTVGYAASISATGKTAVTETITRVSSTQNTNANTSTTGTGASGEVAVDDGTRPTNSMRFAASYTGAATPVAQGTNSTLLQSLDSTAFGSSFVRETTAGVGSRSVGFATGTTDDWALVAVAVSEIDVTATGAISVPSATVAGTGAEVFTATGALSVPSATVSGSGAEVFTATGALTVPAATVAGSGDHTQAVPTGTGAISVPAATVAGSGALILTATGALSVPPPTVAGTGAEVFTAIGSLSVPPPAVAGTGEEVLSGTGAIAVPPVTVAGSGAEVFTATGAVTVPSPTVAGSGAETASGTGAITVAGPVVAGDGMVVVEVSGSGSITVPAPLVSGVGDGGVVIPPAPPAGVSIRGARMVDRIKEHPELVEAEVDAEAELLILL